MGNRSKKKKKKYSFDKIQAKKVEIPSSCQTEPLESFFDSDERIVKYEFLACKKLGDEISVFVDEPINNIDKDPFLYSLENLTPDDIALPQPKVKKTFYSNILSGLRCVMLIASITIFSVSAYAIVDNLISYKKADDIYATLQNDFTSDDNQIDSIDPSIHSTSIVSKSPPSKKITVSLNFSKSLQQDQSLYNSNDKIDKAVKPYNAKFEQMKLKLIDLKNKNDDTYGWIKVSDTKINYPIVQSTNNEYYLDHAFTGQYLPAGAIYTDYRNYKEILRNYNTVMYGHNMKNGTMFNAITEFLNEETFKNGKIEICTFDGIYTYEVFAIYETRMDYPYIQTAFRSGKEFIDFANTMKSNSIYQKDITFTETDRIITLSTCTNRAMSGRYALQAKLIDISN